MGALNLNKVLIGGRLVKEPSLRETTEKIPVTNILVAVNNKNDTDFLEVSAYGDLAKQICEYCTKGTTVLVQGKLRYYKDDKKLKVNAQTVQFIKDTINTKGGLVEEKEDTGNPETTE